MVVVYDRGRMTNARFSMVQRLTTIGSWSSTRQLSALGPTVQGMSGTEQNEPARRRDWDNPDPVLQVVAAVAERSDDFRMSVTLNVNGTIVTGVLVGHSNWFQQIGESYGGVLKDLFEPIAEAIATNADPDDPRGFIHLVDARFITSGLMPSAPGEKGFLWRGRLAHVSAWAPGTIS